MKLGLDSLTTESYKAISLKGVLPLRLLKN